MATSMQGQAPPPGAVDITSLPTPALSQLQQRLTTELEHLTNSHAKLRSAQQRFRECVKSINDGVVGVTSASKGQQGKQIGTGGEKEKGNSGGGGDILVPLTTSLYVPGRLADREKVLVDVGTGFYVEKTTKDAIEFYNGKVEDLGKNLADLENVVQGKGANLRVVEDVLRQKVLQEGTTTGTAAGSGG